MILNELHSLECFACYDKPNHFKLRITTPIMVVMFEMVCVAGHEPKMLETEAYAQYLLMKIETQFRYN
jgi:hypothetical protein